MAYNGDRNPKVLVQAAIHKRNENRERGVQSHGHNDGAVDGAFDKAQGQRPSATESQPPATTLVDID